MLVLRFSHAVALSLISLLFLNACDDRYVPIPRISASSYRLEGVPSFTTNGINKNLAPDERVQASGRFWITRYGSSEKAGQINGTSFPKKLITREDPSDAAAGMIDIVVFSKMIGGHRMANGRLKEGIPLFKVRFYPHTSDLQAFFDSLSPAYYFSLKDSFRDTDGILLGVPMPEKPSLNAQGYFESDWFARPHSFGFSKDGVLDENNSHSLVWKNFDPWPSRYVGELTDFGYKGDDAMGRARNILTGDAAFAWAEKAEANVTGTSKKFGPQRAQYAALVKSYKAKAPGSLLIKKCPDPNRAIRSPDNGSKWVMQQVVAINQDLDKYRKCVSHFMRTFDFDGWAKVAPSMEAKEKKLAKIAGIAPNRRYLMGLDVEDKRVNDYLEKVDKERASYVKRYAYELDKQLEEERAANSDPFAAAMNNFASQMAEQQQRMARQQAAFKENLAAAYAKIRKEQASKAGKAASSSGAPSASSNAASTSVPASSGTASRKTANAGSASSSAGSAKTASADATKAEASASASSSGAASVAAQPAKAKPATKVAEAKEARAAKPAGKVEEKRKPAPEVTIAYQAVVQQPDEAGLGSSRRNIIFDKAKGSIIFAQSFYRRKLGDKCAIAKGHVLTIEWQFEGSESVAARTYSPYPNVANKWLDERRTTSSLGYTFHQSDLIKTLHKEGCEGDIPIVDGATY